MKSTRLFTTSQMTITAIMAAVTCIMGPLSIPIPISPVPISLTNLAVCLTACLLGAKLAAISYLLYLIIGLAGLPVFSGFSSGIGKLLGPTGGYLIGFIFLALIAGFFFDRFQNKIILFFGMVLGNAIIYLFGTAWLCYEAKLTFIQGLWAGVIPYIPGDLAKTILVLVVGPVVKRRLESAGLLIQNQAA